VYVRFLFSFCLVEDVLEAGRLVLIWPLLAVFWVAFDFHFEDNGFA
jgi:hypothetical protein